MEIIDQLNDMKWFPQHCYLNVNNQKMYLIRYWLIGQKRFEITIKRPKIL